MSKPVTVTIPHQLGVAEARRRIEEGLGQLGSQIPGGMGQLRQSWSGDRLDFSAQAMGQTIAGHLTVLADKVHMEVLLPGFLAMMAGKLKGRLQQQGQILLEKK